MNPDVKRRWVAALRSGDFQQGRGRLATRATYVDRSGSSTTAIKHCCLGVLCELAVESQIVDRVERTTTSGGRALEYDGQPAYVPTVVRDWAGLTESNPVIVGNALSVHNDVLNRSFETIADLIEEQL